MHESTQSPLLLRKAAVWEAREGQHFRLHHHSCWELVYYRSGHIRCPIGDQTFEAWPGTLLLIPPKVVHADIALTDYTNFNVLIEAPVDQPWPRACLDDENHTLGSILSLLVREWCSRSEIREAMLSLLAQQLDLLLRHWRTLEELPENERLVRQAEQMLEGRYATQIMVEAVARELGVSSSHLRTQFARRRGHSPSSHLQAVRVRQALALIGSSNLSLEAIAEQCGFDSQSHLSRNVKRSTGKSPGTFRRR